MVFKMKLIITVFLLSILTVTNTSCSNRQSEASDDKNNPPQVLAETKATTTTETATGPTFSIHQIASVAPSNDPGKYRDFLWVVNGEKKLFSELIKNKVVFLNFWATWCGPCRHEIPSIIDISKELDPSEFVVVGIPLERDRYQSPDAAMERVKSFAVSQGMNYINFNPAQELEIAYGQISGIPTTFIIGKDGSVKEKIVGARSKEDFMTSIKRAMGK